MRKLTYKILYEEYVRLKEEMGWHIYSYDAFRNWFKKDRSMCLTKSLKKEKKVKVLDYDKYHSDYRKENKERLTIYHREHKRKKRIEDRLLKIKEKRVYLLQTTQCQ